MLHVLRITFSASYLNDQFSRKNKGRKDIYISHKVTVADELAKTQSSQVEALILMRAAMIIHKLCLESQEFFNGFFVSQLPHSSIE